MCIQYMCIPYSKFKIVKYGTVVVRKEGVLQKMVKRFKTDLLLELDAVGM